MTQNYRYYLYNPNNLSTFAIVIDVIIVIVIVIV